MPARWTLAQALAALAMELDPERCRALAAAGEDVQRSIAVSSMLDWVPQWRLVEWREELLAELLRRVQARSWKLIRLPNEPGQVEDELTDLEPDDLDIPKSEVILGGQRYRVRVEVRDRRRERPTFDRVKGRVEQALAQGRISWETFDRMTEEAMRARFHPESKTARNIVRAVREALRRERHNC